MSCFQIFEHPKIMRTLITGYPFDIEEEESDPKEVTLRDAINYAQSEDNDNFFNLLRECAAEEADFNDEMANYMIVNESKILEWMN